MQQTFAQIPQIIALTEDRCVIVTTLDDVQRCVRYVVTGPDSRMTSTRAATSSSMSGRIRQSVDDYLLGARFRVRSKHVIRSSVLRIPMHARHSPSA